MIPRNLLALIFHGVEAGFVLALMQNGEERQKTRQLEMDAWSKARSQFR